MIDLLVGDEACSRSPPAYLDLDLQSLELEDAACVKRLLKSRLVFDVFVSAISSNFYHIEQPIAIETCSGHGFIGTVTL